MIKEPAVAGLGHRLHTLFLRFGPPQGRAVGDGQVEGKGDRPQLAGSWE